MKLKELVAEYEKFRYRKEELEEELKEVNKQLLKAEASLSDSMLEEDIPSITVGSFTYHFKSETKYNFKSADDLAQLGVDKFQVLRDNGYDFLITERVDPRSLSSAMKEAEENGGGIPEDLLSILNQYEVQGVNRRKATAKAMAMAKKEE